MEGHGHKRGIFTERQPLQRAGHRKRCKTRAIPAVAVFKPMDECFYGILVAKSGGNAVNPVDGGNENGLFGQLRGAGFAKAMHSPPAFESGVFSRMPL
jgi:hypothetical protein